MCLIYLCDTITITLTSLTLATMSYTIIYHNNGASQYAEYCSHFGNKASHSIVIVRLCIQLKLIPGG